MTIQTPTSELPGGTPPAGLPDLATLNRLAGAFFAALPGSPPTLPTTPLGGVPAPVNVLPGGSSLGPLAQGPQLPGTLAPGANLAPTSPQSVLSLGASTPSLVPHSTAPNGLPDNAAIVPPALDGRFGGHALGVPTARSAPPDPAAASFGFPTGEALRALLAEPPRHAGTPGAATAPTDTTGPFYFTEALQTPQGFATTAPQADATRHPPFDVNAIRRDFPILQERVNGRQLVWFDNAATTQKPQSVIDRIAYFYEHENSNIHRAAHALAARATDAYESAREKVRDFLGASSVDEIIFVRGATEGINLVAKTWGAKHIGEGDEIIVSHLEHHANIVPWQQLAADKGAMIRVIPVDDTGQVLLGEYQKLLNSRTKIVAVTQVSNALGTVVPVKEIVALAHRAGAKVLVDGAQSVSHLRVNVQAIDADFFVFSGHKIFGPTGIGVIYGKRALLDDMPPWQGGGNMIADVTFERTVFQPPPNKFEAGTGNIADAVGLGAAIDYVQRIGLENIARYEHDLLEYATHHLRPIPGVRLIGTAQEKASVLSFELQGYTTEEVGKALNEEGIAVRSGHHCAQPILRRFGVEATVRPSLAFYNTCEEVDRFIAVVRRLSAARRV
ncbi:family 2A encapsulin nanocompartment cargo protein cysteine desulfurase [Hydrogenophaga sp.]|uniref:family 2A encapsulin nanocompartment cargo protein cysteine desulfurase n=1 Tax=Hydrogenophaga sp. TaxID=1904254 RepID=UPI002716D32D|nr:family 2A encapsulin nanocompartment cargo protein cysteine desulfurase [Hydrogenophaga sp.]MDO9434425.1 family 2A encapsulin nanocompartment cargo protein cysteine desulfurase [Hydrogenophaga sp.]